MNDQRPNSFAVAYTVKNEAQLLPKAVAFYLAAGCSKIYIFWDGTTDNGPQRIQASHSVVSMPSVRPSALGELPAWIAEISPRWEENMDVRKRINTHYAARLATDEGIDWLFCIDPDEIVLPSISEPFFDDSIPNFLSSIPGEIDQVLLRNLEVVPTSSTISNPFRECVTFLNRFYVTEFVWRASRAALRRIVRSPELRAWYDHYFYKLRFRGALPRLMRHPTFKTPIPCSYFLGYSNYKSIIRAKRAEHFHFDIHRWRSASAKPRNLTAGFLLHYDFFNSKHLITKFRQRPEANCYNADYARNTIAHIAVTHTDNQVDKFFSDNLVIADRATLLRLQRRRILIKIDQISEFMRRYDTDSSEDTQPTPPDTG